MDLSTENGPGDRNLEAVQRMHWCRSSCQLHAYHFLVPTVFCPSETPSPTRAFPMFSDKSGSIREVSFLVLHRNWRNGDQTYPLPCLIKTDIMFEVKHHKGAHDWNFSADQVIKSFKKIVISIDLWDGSDYPTLQTNSEKQLPQLLPEIRWPQKTTIPTVVKRLEPNTSPLHIFKKQRAQHETHFIIFHPNVPSTKSRIRARRIVESSMVFGNICCNSRANASRGNLKSPCIAIGHWKGNSEIVEWLLGCAPQVFQRRIPPCDLPNGPLIAAIIYFLEYLICKSALVS